MFIKNSEDPTKRPLHQIPAYGANPIDMPVGTWPVMLTPFTQDNRVDWAAYDQLVDFYLASGVKGLFAVCLSSELYCLTSQERIELARRAVARANGKVPVIGVMLAEQSHKVSAMCEGVCRMKDTGLDVVVCLTNSFGQEGDDETIWQKHVFDFLEKADPDIPLGIYECPLPYARNISGEALGCLGKTGRFFLTKDTCCNADCLREKAKAIQGTPLHLYNADICTLRMSMEAGGHGYSGIVANFFPHLIAWMCGNYRKDTKTAAELERFFQKTNPLIHQRYMQSAKIYLERAGLRIGARTRVGEHEFSSKDLAAFDALRSEVEAWEQRLGLENPFMSVG